VKGHEADAARGVAFVLRFVVKGGES
jgi:hypothetical protein